jgi:hypothetical protein
MYEDKPSARQEIVAELHRMAGRLRAMVAAYEENPRVLDEDTLRAASCPMTVEDLITEIYRVMRNQVFTEDSPLRKNEDEWAALKEHQEEFHFFHRSVMNAMECYQEVLRTYTLMKESVWRCPEVGSTARIRKDKRIHLAERASCLEAIANLERKFSAMLTVFRSSEADRGKVVAMH